jgi:hypothetical protein
MSAFAVLYRNDYLPKDPFIVKVILDNCMD